MKQNNRKDILYLHIAVMLFSISGVVGQFVEVPSILVAMGRVVPVVTKTLIFNS